MKKMLNTIIAILIFVLFPSFVLAENVQVKEIKQIEKSEGVEIVSEPKVSDTTIKFDIKLKSIGDYVKYKLVIDNKDDIEYEIDKKSFENNEYITYEVESDNLEKLEANKEKEIYLTIKYNKEVPENEFKDNVYVLNNNFSLAIGNKDEEIRNPQTGIEDYSLAILTIIVVLAVVVYGFRKNKKQFKTLMLIIGIAISIPLTCIAANVLKLNIETNVTIIGVDKCLENRFAIDNWETIATNVKNGNMCGYHVGDEKEIELTGFGKHNVRISNVSKCTNGETSETACGFVIEFVDIIIRYQFNSSGLNVGGWRDTKVRTYINETIYKSLPRDLQNIILTTKVISSYGKNDSANFETEDKLYLLSSEEVFGDFATSSMAGHDTSVGTSKQLDYYKNQGVTLSNFEKSIKQYEENNDYWWLRSVSDDNPWCVYDVANTRGWSNTSAYSYDGISPAFRIA
mgnify:FL=1